MGNYWYNIGKVATLVDHRMGPPPPVPMSCVLLCMAAANILCGGRLLAAAVPTGVKTSWRETLK